MFVTTVLASCPRLARCGGDGGSLPARWEKRPVVDGDSQVSCNQLEPRLFAFYGQATFPVPKIESGKLRARVAFSTPDLASVPGYVDQVKSTGKRRRGEEGERRKEKKRGGGGGGRNAKKKKREESGEEKTEAFL